MGGCFNPLISKGAADAGVDIAARFQPHKDTAATPKDQWVIAAEDATQGQDVDVVGAAADAALDATASKAPACGDGACNGDEWCGPCSADCGVCPKACAPLTSLGCPPGSQCYPNPPDNLCAPPGAAVHGTACSSWNDCAFGCLCVAGVCRSLCDATGTDSALACKPGVPCETLVFDGGAAVAADLGACKPGDVCDPLTDAGCPGGQTCMPTGWLKTCGKAGVAGVGQACTNNGTCLQGLLCVAGACRLRCHTAGGAPSCAAAACVPLPGPDGNPVPGYVGWCK